tara:strand:+ start:256 stop:690 length:435 start_codon:yes stop_codon:yes gene_type:complete
MLIIATILIIISLINLIVFSKTYENYDSEEQNLVYKPDGNDEFINEEAEIINNKNEEYKNDKTLSYSLLDVEYHEDPEIIEKEEGYGINLKEETVYDAKKQKDVIVRIPKIVSLPIYNKPGTYKYGYDNYVPSYKDSIIFSSYN